MEDWFRIIILAVVQGIGEFLPISSSGHLLVLDHFFFGGGTAESEILALGILLHAGTLFSILVYFRKEILLLFAQNRRLIPLLITGTIPGAAVGFWVMKECPYLEHSLPITGTGFLATALFLILAAKKSIKDSGCSLRDIRYRDALVIGIFQAIAVFPGFSRSGFTFCGGLIRGLDRNAAAVFSFLLAIPIISGAILLECCQLFREEADSGRIGSFITGGVISFLIGIGALAWFMRWIRMNRYERFAWWLIPLGIAVLSSTLF
ncbi:MAG: undecaprenyl-diphosphate phosphatase [Planctomycetia bacterium]|nr:undecaprenyl-diphosphate phosphatase [Planctomycetia bacterium]